MSRLAKLALTEARLFWRDPTGWFFALAFPPLLLVILGSIPAFREPDAELGGLRVIDLYVPILVGFVLAMLAISVLPSYLATYREKGILRRLSVTPVQPSRPCPTSDLFDAGGRELLQRLGLPEPWAGTTAAAVALIDEVPAVDADRGCGPRPPPSRLPRPRPGHQAAARQATRPPPAVVCVEVARRLAEAIWHLLTTQAPFAPARPQVRALAA
jgi:hypothetical protein